MKTKEIFSKTEGWVRNIICILMALIMSFLFIESFMHTMKLSVTPELRESITYHHDNFIFNAIYMAASLLIISVVAPKLEKIPLIIQIAVLSAVTITLGSIWVMSAKISPTDDSYLVTHAASMAINNDFSFMEDRYFSNSPYQLGMVFFFEAIMRLFGSGKENLLYIEIINVIHLAFAYAGIILILGKTFKSKRIQSISALTMLLSMQPILFSTFLYGIIPGITYAIYSVLFEIMYFQSSKKTRFIWAALSAVFITLSIMVKTNNYIALIAVVIIALVKFIQRFKVADIIYIAVTLVLALNILSSVCRIYENRSNIKLNQNIPMISWMAMGLDYPYGILGCNAAGWYSSVHTTMEHEKNNYDTEKTAEATKKVIKERLSFFLNNYNEANDFFYEKNTSQWNEPSYASIWTNMSFRIKYGEQGKTAVYILDKGYEGMLSYMNVFQLFVFMSALAGVFVCFRKNDIFCCVFILIILGGFMYHMMFEGKSQYIMPYFILMTGFSAVGTDKLIDIFNNFIAGRRKKVKSGNK